MPPRRRLRPTLLLRCLSLLLTIVVFWITFTVVTATGLTRATILTLAIVWFIGIEAGVIPLLLERWITRSAESAGKASNIWFYDRDAEQKNDLHSFHQDSSENPTVR